MKDKIFAKLKQEYSSLGLGDEMLQAHAGSLANLGLVNDTNLDAVVAAQKPFLEGLQRALDKRATDAAKKAEEKAKAARQKEIEEAEEKAKAEEEAAKKAAEEAAKDEAAKKAEEEAKKKAEENNANTKWEERFKQLQDSIAALAKTSNEKYTAIETDYKSKYDALVKEAEAKKAEEAKRLRSQFITETAKKLGIPQYRIDEGFSITDIDDDAAVTEYLTKVSNNIKTNSVPVDKKQVLGEDKPSKEEIGNLAKILVK